MARITIESCFNFNVASTWILNSISNCYFKIIIGNWTIIEKIINIILLLPMVLSFRWSLYGLIGHHTNTNAATRYLKKKNPHTLSISDISAGIANISIIEIFQISKVDWHSWWLASLVCYLSYRQTTAGHILALALLRKLSSIRMDAIYVIFDFILLPYSQSFIFDFVTYCINWWPLIWPRLFFYFNKFKLNDLICHLFVSEHLRYALKQASCKVSPCHCVVSG